MINKKTIKGGSVLHLLQGKKYQLHKTTRKKQSHINVNETRKKQSHINVNETRKKQSHININRTRNLQIIKPSKINKYISCKLNLYILYDMCHHYENETDVNKENVFNPHVFSSFYNNDDGYNNNLYGLYNFINHIYSINNINSNYLIMIMYMSINILNGIIDILFKLDKILEISNILNKQILNVFKLYYDEMNNYKKSINSNDKKYTKKNINDILNIFSINTSNADKAINKETYNNINNNNNTIYIHTETHKQLKNLKSAVPNITAPQLYIIYPQYIINLKNIEDMREYLIIQLIIKKLCEYIYIKYDMFDNCIKKHKADDTDIYKYITKMIPYIYYIYYILTPDYNPNNHNDSSNDNRYTEMNIHITNYIKSTLSSFFNDFDVEFNSYIRNNKNTNNIIYIIINHYNNTNLYHKSIDYDKLSNDNTKEDRNYDFYNTDMLVLFVTYLLIYLIINILYIKTLQKKDKDKDYIRNKLNISKLKEVITHLKKYFYTYNKYCYNNNYIQEINLDYILKLNISDKLLKKQLNKIKKAIKQLEFKEKSTKIITYILNIIENENTINVSNENMDLYKDFIQYIICLLYPIEKCNAKYINLNNISINNDNESQKTKKQAIYNEYFDPNNDNFINNFLIKLAF